MDASSTTVVITLGKLFVLRALFYHSYNCSTSGNTLEEKVFRSQVPFVLSTIGSYEMSLPNADSL